MSGIPALTTTTRTARRVFSAPDRDVSRSRSVVVDSTNADSGNTPTTTLRPGNVLALRTSTGRFVEANDANGDRNAPASVTALVTGAAAHASAVISFAINGGPTQTVTLGAGDNTDTLIAAALNANAAFAAQCVADVVAARVRVRTLNAGAQEHLAVWDNVAAPNTLFALVAAPSTDVGSDAEYVVIDEWVDLIDSNGTAIHAGAVGWLSGSFVRTSLINLTAEAEAVIMRRGSRIE